MLFFALPFPCVIYFSTSWPMPLSQRAEPWWALTLLAISLALWLVLLYQFLDKLLLGPVRALQRVRGILVGGVTRSARVEHAGQTGAQVRGFAQWKLRLVFDNLSGSPITDELVVVDTKPEQRRFDIGRTLTVRLSRAPGVVPNLVLEGTRPETDRRALWLRGLLGACATAVVAAAYIAAWRVQNEGMGWTFLSFGHPLLICPLVLCSYLVTLRVLLRLMQGDAKGESLKFRGVRTTASVLDVRQTGTYLNEQPQVEFKLAFDDANGVARQASLRRFWSLIDLANIPRHQLDILYDPEDPAQVQMVSP
nr:hypothetical protein [Stenotrophomonas tumulicola]